MNSNNSILLISDDNDLAEVLEAKLIFLRSNDTIVLSDFKNACANLKLCGADIVLIHENSSKNKLWN